MGDDISENYYYKALGEEFHQLGMPFEQEMLLYLLNKQLSKQRIIAETGISMTTINKILRNAKFTLRHTTFSKLFNFYIWMRLTAGEPL